MFQLTSLLVDRGLDLEAAMHAPRINVDNPEKLEADPRLEPAVMQALAAVGTVTPAEATSFPAVYATPLVVLRDGDVCVGAAHVNSPAAAAIGA